MICVVMFWLEHLFPVGRVKGTIIRSSIPNIGHTGHVFYGLLEMYGLLVPALNSETTVMTNILKHHWFFIKHTTYC